MGTPTYKPTYRPTSYNGKGSTRRSESTTVSREPKEENRKSKSPMAEMLEFLKEVEKCRDDVETKQRALDSAKKALERAEKKVSAQIDKLDPETKARFRKMMGGISNQDPGDGNEER